MHSDTPSEKINTSKRIKGISLSLLTAGTLFFLLSFVVFAMLIVTYNSSQIVVENELEQLETQSGTIGNLVLEGHLVSLEQFVTFLAEEISLLDKTRDENMEGFIEGAFFSQKESAIDFLAFLSVDGIFTSEINTELFPFPNIHQHIKKAMPGINKWFWTVEEEKSDAPPIVLIYYKREVLERYTGRLEGYLIGGLFLSDNLSLVEEIQEQTDAQATRLLWSDRVLASAGGAPHNTENTEIENWFKSDVLSAYFPNAGFQTLTLFSSGTKSSLDQLYLISAAIGLILILGMSVLSVFLGRILFLRPLKELTAYARKVERREVRPELPISIIAEFNEVGGNLKNVLSAFQESEKRFQDIANVTSDSIWETDADHRYIFLSRQGNQNEISNKSEIIGKKRWEVEGVDHLDPAWETHKELIAKQHSFRNFVFSKLDEKGDTIYWSSSGKPMFDRSGVFLGYRGTSADITTEIEAQREAEKIQNQLRQSQKLEVVGQLTGGIAHDFNNLLSVVIGNLELVLEKDDLDKPARKMLNDAMRGAEKGAALTHQLLAYSRQQALQPAVVRPCEIIMGIESLLRRAVGERIEFLTHMEDHWSIMIDPNELENALMNLVVNARDAIAGGGAIRIESFNIEIDPDYAILTHGFSPGDYVCIVVSDTGHGIPNEIKDRIFEPFFTTKEVGKGSGLGLSMVFGFASQSEGHVSIDSEEGQGTTIKLFLPRSCDEAEKKSRFKNSTVRHGEGEHVLIVEDDKQVCDMVSAQLQSIGYVTSECEDGAAALDILTSEEIDVLLCDVILPGGMSGVEIIQKSRQKYPDMPKILMCDFTGSSFMAESDLPEGVDVLFKPFSKLKLSEAIHKAKIN